MLSVWILNEVKTNSDNTENTLQRKTNQTKYNEFWTES